jgi:methionyl-tRNA formyltransferase
VAQPESVRAPAFLDWLESFDPTTMVVVAFGQVFTERLLQMPRQGCINVHASLLPRHRGAAPIQAAIIAGDQVTGVTTMLMDKGLDTGPILLQRELVIGPEETSGELAERLAVAGGELLVETLERQEKNLLVPRNQDHAAATLARRLDRSDGIIDWQAKARRIFNLLRGLTPWPGVSTTLRGQPVKVLWGRPIDIVTSGHEGPGMFLGLVEGRLAISCGEGTGFGIERLQSPGRRPVTAEGFANGQRLTVGEQFG